MLVATAPPQPRQYSTIGQIANDMDKPVHIVRYAIMTRHIVHDMLAARVKLYGAEAIGEIRRAMAEIAAR